MKFSLALALWALWLYLLIGFAPRSVFQWVKFEQIGYRHRLQTYALGVLFQSLTTLHYNDRQIVTLDQPLITTIFYAKGPVKPANKNCYETPHIQQNSLPKSLVKHECRPSSRTAGPIDIFWICYFSGDTFAFVTSQNLELDVRANEWDSKTILEINKLLARRVIQHLILPLRLDESSTSQVLEQIVVDQVEVMARIIFGNSKRNKGLKLQKKCYCTQLWEIPSWMVLWLVRKPKRSGRSVGLM